MHWKPGNIFKLSRQDHGFTLIEVLIALAVFSIGILAVGSMQFKSTRGSTNARTLTEASIWAQDRVETLMSIPYDDPNLADGGAQYTANSDNYNVTWQVWGAGDVAPGGVIPAINTKIIQVTVTGRDKKAITGRDNNRCIVTFVRARDV